MEYTSYIDENTQEIVLHSLFYGDEARAKIKDKHRGTPKEEKKLQKLRKEWRKWVIASDRITIYDGEGTKRQTVPIAKIEKVGISKLVPQLSISGTGFVIEFIFLNPNEREFARQVREYIIEKKNFPDSTMRLVAERVVQCNGCASRVTVAEGTTVQCKYCGQPVG